jgi:hypothetical protein
MFRQEPLASSILQCVEISSSEFGVLYNILAISSDIFISSTDI